MCGVVCMRIHAYPFRVASGNSLRPRGAAAGEGINRQTYEPAAVDSATISFVTDGKKNNSRSTDTRRESCRSVFFFFFFQTVSDPPLINSARPLFQRLSADFPQRKREPISPLPISISRGVTRDTRPAEFLPMRTRFRHSHVQSREADFPRDTRVRRGC